MSQDPSGRAARNRLAGETSPYLRQHAANPVAWQPWDAAALGLARATRKPILLSIGYAACHWCHVMAHESFEDEATARLMNERFVNIKVDREERPDLDRIYQLAQQMLTGRGGGWPLTMFLMHDDQRPFFGGTYFPPQPRHGLPAFATLLDHVADYYRDHEAELRASAGAVAQAFAGLAPPPAGDARPDEGPLRACRAQLEATFDARWGGFSGAPKFPHSLLVQRLLRDWHATASGPAPDLHALYMATLTLSRMAEGGLVDQLGGGFYRYCVDGRWEIPHFEKMLYDNALLLGCYAEAAAATGEPLFREVARRTADFMLGTLRAPGGAFHSSLDADAAGVEGSYYVWSPAEVREVVGPAAFPVFAARHGLDGEPNFEGHAHHLVARTPLAQLVPLMPPTEQAGGEAAVAASLGTARELLLARRAARTAPGLDDKVLASWNALAIRGLATTARMLGRADCAAAAGAALDYLRRVHWRDGRLLATSAGGEARLGAYLDDHVFLADAVLELQTVRFDAAELGFAIALVERVLAEFADSGGAFHFTPAGHETLFARPISLADEALPSGNGVAAIVLQRLGALLGEPRYLAAADAALRAAWSALAAHPTAHATLLQALEESLHPPDIVVLRGSAAEIEPWRAALAPLYAPRRLVVAVPDPPPGATPLPASLAAKPALPGGAAYVCRGTRCTPPITGLEPLLAELRAG